MINRLGPRNGSLWTGAAIVALLIAAVPGLAVAENGPTAAPPQPTATPPVAPASPATRPAPTTVAPATAAVPVTAPAPAAVPTAAKVPTDAAKGTPATVIDNGEIFSILGRSVHSPTGEDMGRIVDILVEKKGDLRAAVIDFGGFFGVGSRKIAVDWSSLHFRHDAKGDRIVTDMPQNQLRVAPVYKDGEPVVVLEPTPEKPAAAASAAAASAPATTAASPAPPAPAVPDPAPK